MSNKKPKIYFGHPINFYNTKKESELIVIIKEVFPDFRIENPAKKIHSLNYQKWREKTCSGMDYFYEKVLPKMDAGVFMTFKDRMFGAGVFDEMAWLHNNKKEVWEIDYDGGILSRIHKLDYSRKLSVEETRKRVYR
jgi:hypothetical protein